LAFVANCACILDISRRGTKVDLVRFVVNNRPVLLVFAPVFQVVDVDGEGELSCFSRFEIVNLFESFEDFRSSIASWEGLGIRLANIELNNFTSHDFTSVGDVHLVLSNWSSCFAI